MNRSSWHVVADRKKFDELFASLDSRGKRELDLKTRFGQSTQVVNRLRDDAKEQSAKEERKKRRSELEDRRQELFLACKREAEMSRRSRRNQSTTESQLKDVESKIIKLDEEIARSEAPVVFDYEDLTGLELLREFDLSMGRNTKQSRGRRTRKNDADDRPSVHIDLVSCSTLWPSSGSKKTGIVGLMVADLLRVETFCQSLCPETEETRLEWRGQLEDLCLKWNQGNFPFVGPAEEAEGTSESQDYSPGKRRRSDGDGETTSQAISSQSVIASMRKPLLDLESRVYSAMGSAMADKDSQVADDNMSTAEEDKENQMDDAAAELKRDMPWKRLLHELSHTPAKRHSQVRKLCEGAMRAARIARRPEAVARLRAALLLHHPNAAGECKTAAVGVLSEFGGYNPADDDFDEEGEVEADDEEEEDEDFPSMLSSEAMMITGSLDGSEMANRVDWKDAVRGTKTLSRFGSLLHSFCRNAKVHLDMMKSEKDELQKCMEQWKKEEDKKKRSRNGQPKGRGRKSGTPVSPEVWADVEYLDEFCVVKLDDLWWPARKCVAKETQLEEQLRGLGRRFVSVVGERGSLRAIRDVDMKDFSVGVNEEEAVQKQTKELRDQLDDCMTMTRRILRGSEQGA